MSLKVILCIKFRLSALADRAVMAPYSKTTVGIMAFRQ